MNIDDFAARSNTEQAGLLKKHAVLLASRFFCCSRIYLYALSSVYIELFQELSELEYAPARILRVFDDPSELDDYLDDIDISDLTAAFRI